MMKVLSLLIACILAVATPAFAQKSQAIEFDDFQLHNARAATHDGTFVSVDRSNTVSFDVLISGTATVKFRVSGAGSFGWNDLSCVPSDSTSGVTETTASGLFTCNVAGANVVSARVDDCTDCSVSVVARRSTATLGGGGGGGTTGWPSDSTTKRVTWANAFANAIGFGDLNDYWAAYRDPTDGLQFICVVAGVQNGCNYIRKLAAGKYFEIQNSSGTSIFRVTEATGAVTNMTMDTEATGNAITIKRYKWLPAGGCTNTTPSTAWDLPTSNPAVAACRTGTNTTKGVLNFADGANALTAQWTEFLNEDWTGAIDATIVWQSGSTSTNNVVWQLAIACAGASDADDPAFTDDVFTADANDATANDYNLTAANTITTTGTCAANDVMHIRVKRDPAHASDNLAATAQLVGVSLKLREAQ